MTTEKFLALQLITFSSSSVDCGIFARHHGFPHTNTHTHTTYEYIVVGCATIQPPHELVFFCWNLFPIESTMRTQYTDFFHAMPSQKIVTNCKNELAFCLLFLCLLFIRSSVSVVRPYGSPRCAVRNEDEERGYIFLSFLCVCFSVGIFTTNKYWISLSLYPYRMSHRKGSFVRMPEWRLADCWNEWTGDRTSFIYLLVPVANSKHSSTIVPANKNHIDLSISFPVSLRAAAVNSVNTTRHALRMNSCTALTL